jgi:hypothetical protein
MNKYFIGERPRKTNEQLLVIRHSLNNLSITNSAPSNDKWSSS